MLNWIENAAAQIWLFLIGLAVGVFTGILTNWWAAWAKRRRIQVAIAFGTTLLLAASTPVVVGVIRDRLDTRLDVVLLVRSDGVSWSRHTEASPGDLLEYRLEIRNIGPGSARDVVAGVNASDYMRWVPWSTHIAAPKLNARPVESEFGERGALISGGVYVGDLLPNQTAEVQWSMRVDPINVFEKLGRYTLKTAGIGRVPGKTGNVHNMAWVDVLVESP